MRDEIAAFYRVLKRNGEYKDVVSRLINMFYCPETGKPRFGRRDYIKSRCGCRSLFLRAEAGIFRLQHRFPSDRQSFMFVSQSCFIEVIVIRTKELSRVHLAFNTVCHFLCCEMTVILKTQGFQSINK